MKRTFVGIFLFAGIYVSAQFANGFDKDEARDMITLCNSFTFIDLYNSDAEILLPEYKKHYTSGVFGMDNKYQIYQKGNIAVINLRGSTSKKVSWLENIYSAMIPAQGMIIADGNQFNYKFAQDPDAAVHSGFALGIAFLANDLLFHIKYLNQQGIYHFIITGHSQGGALANLLRAYLENLAYEELSPKNEFKTYSFAAPMIGNETMTNEYNERFAMNNTSFNINIPQDPIPYFPITYSDKNILTNSLEAMASSENIDFKRILRDGAIQMFEKNLTQTVHKLSESTAKQIEKEVGQVTLPPYVEEINYKVLQNLIQLKPVAYPKMLKDSSIMQNDSLMAIYKIGPDGHFYNEELYKPEPWGYQHKPYNYYVSFLEKYFPEQYMMLEKKYLLENL